MSVRKRFPSRSFPSDRRAWLIFILVAVFGGGLSYAWFHRRVLKAAPAPLAVAPLSSHLVVLEFGRVVEKAAEAPLDGSKVAGFIRALKAHGFVPVRASEVAEAYQNGRILPPRSVLLSFDGGYLSTYLAVQDLLAREQCPALMLLEGGCQERRDSAFLYWDRLGLMLDSGLWELGTHGIVRSAQAQPLASDSAAAGEAVFQEARAFIESHLPGAKVQVYSPLMGRTPELAGGLKPSEGPALAFQADLFGVNTPQTNPLKLRRLRVEPEWSPEQLLQRLEWSLTTPSELAEAGNLLPRWIADRPELTTLGTTLTVRGPRRNTVWLAGSSEAEDWVLEARVWVDSGEFWFIQELEPGGRHWRFGGKDGTLYFQDRRPGSPPLTLARVPLESGSVYGWHDFRITRRGGGVLVECDGHPMGDRPFQVPERIKGYVGITSAPSDRPGSLQVADSRFRPFHASSVATTGSPAESEVRQLAAQATSIGTLNPPWMVCRGETREVAQLDAALFGMLRNRYAWDILPVVRIDDRACSKNWVVDLPAQVKAAGWNGVQIDLGALDAEGRDSWGQALAGLRKELEFQGLRLQVVPANKTMGGAR